MTRLRTIKTNFTAGEVSERLLGRGDLRAFENGARRLRNVFIFPTGGVTRRAGLRHVGSAGMEAGQEGGRLASFEFNTEQVYLLLFRHLWVDIYRDDVLVQSVATPWQRDQVAQLYWTQTADTLLVCHPAVPPKKLIRTLDAAQQEVWLLKDWAFVEEKIFGHKENGKIEFFNTRKEVGDKSANVNGLALRQPYFKYADETVTVTPSGKTGAISVTASEPVFQPAHVGTYIRIETREISITGYTSPTEIAGNVRFELNESSATKDWEEQAFSSIHGWPATCTFHQDRLVIGGSRDQPNRLWLSKAADLFNFDLGEGLDDESIEFAILSDQVNAIRGVFSGRHLQVFTSGAEWMVTGEPLTPENIQLRRQTRVGSITDRIVPPRDVDGATLYAPRSGRELREFLFADVEQAYQSNDLAILARHLVNDPVDQDYDQLRRMFHVAMADGTLATVTIFRNEEVTAWTRQSTAGAIRSVVVVGNDVYLLIERADYWSIEKFDEALNTDAATTLSLPTPESVLGGLDHLEGKSVKILADGAVHPDRVVAGGSVVLDDPATSVEVGLGYSHTIEPLPVAAAGQAASGQGIALRLIEATFRLLDTQALRVDVGGGPKDIPFKKFGDEGVLDLPPAVFTGDKKVRALGWTCGGTESLWRVEQDVPLPSTLLSVTSEIKVND